MRELSDLCETCNTNVDHVVYDELVGVADTLIFKLRRYVLDKSNPALREPTKTLSFINLPQTFRLGDSVYRLTCVICHHGESMHSGHYTSFAYSNR